MRLLIFLASAATSVLLWRWGMGISSPKYDSYYALRVVGWCERAVTQADAWLSRVKVGMIDRLELDQLAWVKLRAHYTPEMS